MFRRPFSRKSEFVAVKTFRFDAATLLQPGDPLPENTRLFHTMSLFRRRLIGAKEDPWTLTQVAPAPPAPPAPPDIDDYSDDLDDLDDLDDEFEDELDELLETEVEPEAEGEKLDADGETEDK